MRLAIRRSTAQAGLLATAGAVALVLTALVVGLTGYLDFSAAASTRAYFANATPTASGVQVETKLGDDPAAQSAAADALFTREFGSGLVDITRTLTDFPLPATLDGEQLTIAGREARITPSSDAGLADHATLVDGAWPGAASGDGTVESPYAGVLQAEAAKQLGFTVGDVLELGASGSTTFVEIVGTWRPEDAGDSRWFSDPGVATGNAIPAGDGTESFGPLMVDEAVLPTLGPIPFVHWTIAVAADRVTPGDLPTLGSVATNLRQAIIDDGTIGKGDILVTGSLAETTMTVQRGLNSVRGVTPVGILLAALIGLIALVQLARLLSLARRPENALLRSRGASGQWLTLTGAAEAVVVAILGCALGFAAGAGALLGLFGGSALAFAPWEFAALVGVAVLVIYGTTAFLDSIRLARRDEVDDSGRARTAATMGTAVFAVAGAGVAVWQSLLYGSPIVTSASGRTVVDPLIVVAPALALVAIALVLLVAFGPLTFAWQRIATGHPRLQPSYSARQVARGIGSYAVAVLVITLAVGGLVTASAYSGSWRSLGDRNAQLTAGADIRITLTDSNFPLAEAEPVTGAEFLGVLGVTDAAPVFSTPLTIGEGDAGRLTGIPAPAIDTAVNDASGAVDTAGLDAKLGGFALRGIELPAGATSINLNATLRILGVGSAAPTPTKGYVQSRLWFQSLDGGIVATPFLRVELEGLPAGEPTTTPLRFDLEPTSNPWWLVAIDYTARADAGRLETTYGDLTATTPSGTEHIQFDTRSWGIQPPVAFDTGRSMHQDGLELRLPGEGSLSVGIRLTDVGATSPTQDGYFMPVPVPVAVSEELAGYYDLSVGDPFDLRFAGSGLVVKATIVSVEPALPGAQSTNMVLADLNALTNFLLRVSPVVPSANQVWLSTDRPVSVGHALPDGATVVTPATATDNSFATPAELALWVVAIGSLLLAAISLAAVALTVSRARRGEVAVLRAVGLSARQQSRSRLAELTAIVLLSAFFGLLGGLIVSALTTANLARSAVLAVPRGLPATLEFALTPGGTLLAIALAVMLGIAGLSAAGVRRQAFDTDERLETR